LDEHYPDDAQAHCDDEAEQQGGLEALVVLLSDASVESAVGCEVDLVGLICMWEWVPRLKLMMATANRASAKRAATMVQQTSVEDLLRSSRGIS
jgi:hypothetical protein